jgi:glycosyltransferase involved in cell wall biosynthesis
MNAQLPVISVVTVTRNALNGLNQTKLSLQCQIFTNFEWIIVDGASIDGTPQVYEEFKDLNLTFLSEPDEGLYYAMNKGINLAKGDVIGILNAEDTYQARSLMILHQAMLKNPDADIYYGSLSIDKVQVPPISHTDLPKRMIYHPATFVRRNVYAELGGFNTKYKIAADYDLLLRAYKNGYKFCFINDSLADYQTGGFSSRNVMRSIIETLQVQFRNPSVNLFFNIWMGIKSLSAYILKRSCSQR